MLGAAFFYPSALAQVPWGRLTDRIGGRLVIAPGLIALAGFLAWFASAQSLNQAIGWRVAAGVVAACAFVPIASVLARWFRPAERAMANGVYYGFGGGLGEAPAFLLLPLITLYFLDRPDGGTPDWRGATLLVASVIGVIGLLCLWLLRAAPRAIWSGRSSTRSNLGRIRRFPRCCATLSCGCSGSILLPGSSAPSHSRLAAGLCR